MQSSTVLVEASPNNPLISLLRIPLDFLLQCVWVCFRTCLLTFIRVFSFTYALFQPFFSNYVFRFLSYCLKEFSRFFSIIYTVSRPFFVYVSDCLKSFYFQYVWKYAQLFCLNMKKILQFCFDQFCLLKDKIIFNSRLFVEKWKKYVLAPVFDSMVKTWKLVCGYTRTCQNYLYVESHSLIRKCLVILRKYKKVLSTYFQQLWSGYARSPFSKLSNMFAHTSHFLQRMSKNMKKNCKKIFNRLFLTVFQPFFHTFSDYMNKGIQVCKKVCNKYISPFLSSLCHRVYFFLLHSKNVCEFFLIQNRLRLSVFIPRTISSGVSLINAAVSVFLYRCRSLYTPLVARTKSFLNNSVFLHQTLCVCKKITKRCFSSFSSLITMISNTSQRVLFTPLERIISLGGKTIKNSVEKIVRGVWGGVYTFAWIKIPSFYHHFGLFVRAKLRKGISHNNFTLHIPQGQLVRTAKANYLVMDNMTPYVVKMENENAFCCNATLWIDGTSAGCWRLRPFSSYTLSRPVCEAKRFIFVQENSKLDYGSVDHTTKIIMGNKMNGEIEVKFVPCFPKPVEAVKPKIANHQRRDVLFKGVRGDLDVKFNLWDTAGQERFRALGRCYYRGAHAVVVAFDLTDRASFEAVANTWVKEAKENTQETEVYVLVGTKCDLTDITQITHSEATDLAESLGFPYLETSAKSNINVDQIFHTIAEFAAQIVPRFRPTLELKIIFIGNERVGKTSLLRRFALERNEHKSTIGCAFSTRTLRIKNAPLTALCENKQHVTLEDHSYAREQSSGCISGGSGGESGGHRAKALNARTNTLYQLSSQLGLAANASEQEDETATGGTTLAGHSGQEFMSLRDELVEDLSQVTTLKITLMLSAQYRHQKRLCAILLDHRYPLAVCNVIAEYVYTHSVLDAC